MRFTGDKNMINEEFLSSENHLKGYLKRYEAISPREIKQWREKSEQIQRLISSLSQEMPHEVEELFEIKIPSIY